MPYVVQEVDYDALRQVIEQAFVEEYGPDVVQNVRVAHFNPDVIDVTVVVQVREPAMDSLVLELSEALRHQGVRAAIRIQKQTTNCNHESATTNDTN